MASFEMKLIKACHQNQCIWNRDIIEYNDRKLKRQTWTNIAKSINAPERSCRVRWHSLRDRFRNEYYQSRSGTPKSSTPWPYFQPMMFLKNTLKTHEERSLESRKYIEELGGEIITQNECDIEQVDEEMCMDADFTACFSEDQDNLDFVLKVEDMSQNEDVLEATGINPKRTETYRAAGTPALRVDRMTTRDNNTPPKRQKVSYEKEHSPVSGVVNSHDSSPVKSTIVVKKSDAFLNYIEDIFQKVPEKSKLDFKMDVINYAYKRLKAMRDGNDCALSNALEEPSH